MPRPQLLGPGLAVPVSLSPAPAQARRGQRPGQPCLHLLPLLGSGPLLPAFLSRISATYNWKLGSEDQGSGALRLLNYFLQRNASSQRREGNQIRSTAGSRSQIFSAQRGLDGGGRAGCLGATNPAVTLAASGPEASPTICESQCHSSPKRGPSEAPGPACRAAGVGELLGAPGKKRAKYIDEVISVMGLGDNAWPLAEDK